MTERGFAIENLTVEQAAEALNVKPSTIRRWLLERRIAHRKIGRRCVRIPAGEIKRIQDEGFVPAREVRS